MTSSTVTLRIQELAEAKGLTLEELSQASGISVQTIQSYATAPVELTEKTVADFKRIAVTLSISVLQVIKPTNKTEAFKLKIQELAKQKKISLKQLSHRSGVNPYILGFYATQTISKQILEAEPQYQNLVRISDILGCRLDELKVEAELPTTRLHIEEILQEKGLTLEDLSLITELPTELLHLIATQPINISYKMKDREVTMSNENIMAMNITNIKIGKETAFETFGVILCDLCRCCVVNPVDTF